MEMVMSDVVEEILSRCLVTDLLRCKSVCKSWYSLISSPSFVKLQCKYICNKVDNRRRITMITGFKNTSQYWWYSISPGWVPDALWGIKGSFNGLACIYARYENRILITNPLTREFVELAKPPKLPNDLPYERCLGFGYDSSLDDYKVVTAVCNGHDRALVHILYLKSNIWKLFGQINYWSLESTSGMLLNGALHWLWFDANYPTDKAVIVSFDLAKEEFREIPQPDDTRYVWSYSSILGILEGRLCIFPYDYPPFSIWVMKNYNVKSSWEELQMANSEMKDHALHYMLKDSLSSHYFDDNLRVSTSGEYITSPIFVQTLISPY